MLPIVAALVLVIQQPDPDPVRPQPDTLSLPPTAEQLADAYEDETARELVRRARERREVVDRSIDAYSALARERISAALRVPGRDRTLFLRETATRIDWRREGPIRLDVLGAREVVPPVQAAEQIPEGLRNFTPRLAFDPENSEFLLRLNDDFLRNPLAPDGERHYRYRTGDTTEIRLPDGRAVRLVELRVTPRRSDPHLLRGSFWIEDETAAVVQAIIRPARVFDLAEEEDVPGLLKPIRFEIEYITLEYAFWDFRWWMPRTLAAEGVFQFTRLLKMPFGYTLTYSDYRVEGDTTKAAEIAERDPRGRAPCAVGGGLAISVRIGSGLGRPQPPEDSVHAGGAAGAQRPNMAERDTMRVDTAALDTAATDTTAADTARARRRGWTMEEETGIGVDRCGRELRVDLPADSAALLASDWLSPTIYESDDGLAGELRRVRALASLLGRIDEAPWRRPEPRFSWGPGAEGGLRYNRVEGASIGARVDLDLGRLRMDATGRLALARPRPDVEFSVARPTLARDYRLALYNGVREVDPTSRAFGFGNSFNAFFIGRDNGEYYRATGASLEVRPSAVRPQRYALRLFAERQAAVRTEAEFTVAKLWDRDRAFRPNIAADRADLFGAELTLAGGLGARPDGWRAGATLDLDGAGGDFEFGRAALTLRAGLPALGPLATSFEVAAGTSVGDVPVQRLFYLGGPFTLRGYDYGAARGNAFWRTRAELGYGAHVGRIAVFGDAGWGGDREAITLDAPLRSVGIGATMLDGMIRADLARALDGPQSWKLHLWLSLDGV